MFHFLVSVKMLSYLEREKIEPEFHLKQVNANVTPRKIEYTCPTYYVADITLNEFRVIKVHRKFCFYLFSQCIIPYLSVFKVFQSKFLSQTFIKHL